MKNQILSKIKENRGIILAFTIIAFLAGYLISGSSVEYSEKTAESEEVEVWTCSMHPQIRQPEPGLCPICGMDLIPVEKEQSDRELGPAELELSSTARKLADIQTTVVERKWIPHQVRLYGKVAVDETRYKTITAWVGGRITELYVDYTGLTVKKGQPLLQLYSPDLYVAQKEYLQAVQSADNAYSHQETMSKKLLFYGLTGEQVDSLEKSGQADPYTIISAPIGGVVLNKKALRGEYVQTGTVLYEIADLSRVWVYLNAYETDLSFLQEGQGVSFQLKAFPGKLFDGKIDFIDPALDPQSRTIKVRVIAANNDLKLKPGLLVTATVFSKERPQEEKPLVIPASAALVTGERAVVYVADGSKQGVFAGREVVLGERLNDHFVVALGLTPGERVVTNGAFKIDSEMQIRAKKSMMNPQGDEGMVTHTHAEMVSTEQPQHRHGETQTEHDQMTEKQRKQKKPMPEDFYKQLKTVISRYYTVQQALSQDDGEKGAEAAENLKIAVAAMDADYGHGWAEIYGKFERFAETLAVAENINKERKAFEQLSNTLIQIVSAYGIPEDMVVEQYHCPMAFDDKGADWLSNRGKVENPYYGSQMFRCGSKVKSFSDTETKDSEHE
ncbi:efflux RND transporter periplasmic adaptor subunit [candidate division KSB1 bacterium]|nr:efflux RND transporter periplasmic adaptor subunit [candidate division KSB1 bacterium]